jgi:hypothetical protein
LGGWGDWLGSENKGRFGYAWRPYEEAKEFVSKLGLKGFADWAVYRRGDRADLPARPYDIPTDPGAVYEQEFYDKGGWGAWLGTDFVSTLKRDYLPTEEAIKYVHSLKLTSMAEWTDYCKGKRPDLPTKTSNIPSAPMIVYKPEYFEKGGMGAWLGTGYKRDGWRTYQDARSFVHHLGLKSSAEWIAYCKNNYSNLPSKPKNIPNTPDTVYKTTKDLVGSSD